MSNLLDFHSDVSEGKETVFDINKQEINSKKLIYEETDSFSTYKVTKFTKKDLRKFINDNSDEIYNNGNVLKGRKENNLIKLIIAKRL